jgi:pilus assembly protein CpaE
MPILCEPPANARELSYSIGGQVRAARNLSETAKLLDADPTEILVVVGPATPTSDALEFAAAMRLGRPVAGVVLMRAQVDMALLSRALQAGVREVVPANDYEALAAACHRSRDVSRRMLAAVTGHDLDAQPDRQGRVVTVFSAKGGCGKTTLAVNLGVALAKSFAKQVCVVDLDLSFGDVGISVQLDPIRTIVDALPMAGHLDTTGAASMLTRYRAGLSMLLAPAMPGDAERIPPALTGELLTVLSGMFDFVVVDTPAHFSEHVLTAMDASAHHVLLTTPDVPALKNLRVTLDMLDLLSYSRDIRSVVLNRSDSRVGLSLEDVERIVRCPIAAHVPSSRAVPISINKGVPITIGSGSHPVSQAITRFAERHLLATGGRGGPGTRGQHQPAGRGRRPS